MGAVEVVIDGSFKILEISSNINGDNNGIINMTNCKITAMHKAPIFCEGTGDASM